MYNTKIGNRDKLIGVGLIVIVVLLVFGLISPPSPSGDVTVYQEREVLYKHQISRLQNEKKVLLSRDSVREIALRQAEERAIKSEQKVKESLPVYVEIRTANEATPDSADYKKEALEGRVVIDAQEEHINALLDVIKKGDDLLKSKLDIIANQEEELMEWPKRFDNMIAQKDEEIKQERKNGNKKFLKGLGIGSAATIALIILL